MTLPLATLVLLVFVSDCLGHEEVPRLLLISFDGFRWDYLDIVRQAGIKTPTFDQLIDEGVGVRNPGVTNAFITKTFPNHYTIVTGLYEESHGIVANDFYDPVFNESFSIHDPVALDIKWWNGTGSQTVVPVWITNEHSGEDHRVSGVYMWPGSEVHGQQPTYYKKYNDSTTFRQRSDEVVKWFTDKNKPINFGAVYMPEPDATGHTYGPYSEEVAHKIAELDGDLRYLLDRLEQAKLLHELNIIITSDHGMDSIQNYIYLDDYVDPSLYKSHGGSPVKHIWPNAGALDKVYSQLQSVSNVSIFRREQFPEEFHYQHNRRISPIIVVADKGFQLCDNRKCGHLKGDHGYDNKRAEMHPIFIAHGPAFKKKYVSEPFESVDVYPLICHLLDITPRPNNGSLKNVEHILSDEENLDITMITFISSVIFCAFIAAVWCIGACRLQRYTVRSRADVMRKSLQFGTVSKTPQGNEPLLVSDEEEDAA